MIPRYAFEEVESAIDVFADRQSTEFKRAWVKLKFLLAAYAFVDYNVREHQMDADDQLRYLSYAWEDFHITCTGQGEAMLTGALLHLWDQLPDSAETEFYNVLVKAFAAAEARTDPLATRSYHESVRKKKIRSLEQGYDLRPAQPCLVRHRAWTSSHFTPDGVREIWFWLNFMLAREKER